MSDFSELAIDGRLATPGDSDWDQARAAWNLAADQRPSAVAFVESAEDVAKTVAFAARHALRVAGQGTGHGAVALGSLEDPDGRIVGNHVVALDPAV
jgi:FAD/FMN-containing dehydrogenase